VQLFGAGIDRPTRPGRRLPRIARAQRGSGYGGVDLAALDVDGRVDFTGSLTLPHSVPAKPVSIYRVYLRDNDIDFETHASRASRRRRTEPLSPNAPRRNSGHFTGILVQEGERSTASASPRPCAAARSRSRARGSSNATGACPRDERRANALPLDAEHLAFFLDAKTVKALVEGLHLSGTVDIENGELAVTTSRAPPAAACVSRARSPRATRSSTSACRCRSGTRRSTFRLDLRGGHVRLDAAVDGLQGRVADRLLENTRLRFTYVEPHLSILELAGTLEKGQAAPDARPRRAGEFGLLDRPGRPVPVRPRDPRRRSRGRGLACAACSRAISQAPARSRANCAWPATSSG